MRSASRQLANRGVHCIFSRVQCAGIVQRRISDTCCLGRALEKTRCLPGERTKREKEREAEGRNDAYKLRSSMFTPFTSAVLPTLQSPSWLIYRRGTRELSLPFLFFSAISLLSGSRYFSLFRLRKERWHAIIYNAKTIAINRGISKACDYRKFVE